MIARQYTLPPLPDDRDDPLVQAEVQTIRTKLGTKECFPDLNTLMSSVERKMEKLKGAESKQRHLQQAIQDLTYILDASESVYGFLGRVGGVEDPTPFVTYLDTGRSTLFYLQRWLTDVTANSIKDMEREPSVPVSPGSPPTLPVRPIMNTAEVAAYLGKSAHTVRHYICEGKIPFHRTGPNTFPYFLRKRSTHGSRQGRVRRTGGSEKESII